MMSIEAHLENIETAILTLRVLHGRMKAISHIEGPGFGRHGLFIYLSASGLMQSAEDATKLIAEIREHTDTLIELMSSAEKEKLEELMKKVVEAEKELALEETKVESKIRAHEGRSLEYPAPN